MIPILALSAIFLPILVFFILIEYDAKAPLKRKSPRQCMFERRQRMFSFLRMIKSIPQYEHACPTCGKKHCVNQARQRLAYGKQFSCSAECEAIRRKNWRRYWTSQSQEQHRLHD